MDYEPGVTTYGETSALYSVMNGDNDEARRICANMNRGERKEFMERLQTLRRIIEDLNAEHCLHCGGRIGRVNPDQIQGGSRNRVIWFHFETHGSLCPHGDTAAEPAPRND